MVFSYPLELPSTFSSVSFPFILLLLALLGTYLYSYREVLDHIRHYLQNALPSFDPKIMKNILRIIQAP